VKLVVGICNALEYVHANGIIHRDLSPDKIMVDVNDNVKLFDFGFAAITGARRLTFANLSASLGTPGYISPEQVSGTRGDARSDIYSAGVILYEMLTGTKPFSGANTFAIMNDRLLRDPVPPRKVDPEISPEMQTIILHALEREPRNRYANARAFANDLLHPDQVEVNEPRQLTRNVQPIQKGDSKSKPNRTLIYIVVAIIPLLIFGLLLLISRSR
jgi:eukaryotic-like serine/threonine-protein kinase